MNDTQIEKADTVPDPSAKLPSPHFDEFAVAVAQPVQPLPPRGGRGAHRLLRSVLFMIAYFAFIVAVAGVAYLRPPGSREDRSSETTATQSDAQPAVTDDNSPAIPVTDESIGTVSNRGTKHARRRVSSRVRHQNQPIEIVEDAKGKPVPRKVGEIRYGRDIDRP